MLSIPKGSHDLIKAERDFPYLRVGYGEISSSFGKILLRSLFMSSDEHAPFFSSVRFLLTPCETVRNELGRHGPFSGELPRFAFGVFPARSSRVFAQNHSKLQRNVHIEV